MRQNDSLLTIAIAKDARKDSVAMKTIKRFWNDFLTSDVDRRKWMSSSCLHYSSTEDTLDYLSYAILSSRQRRRLVQR